jgi:hypothetical protein
LECVCVVQFKFVTSARSPAEAVAMAARKIAVVNMLKICSCGR